MSTVEQSSRPSTQEIRQKIEDYRTTIHALQCFVSSVTWDRKERQPLTNSKNSLGRRMDTSSENRISPSTTVTPDGVIQRNGDIGYIVEAKKSLPSNQDYWVNVIQQLEKYDDDLVGWWTPDETIPTPCVVLLLHISRSADFSNFLTLLLDNNELTFGKPVSVVEFSRSREVKEFIFLRTHWGEIEDQLVSGTLQSGQMVPVEDVIASFGEMKFYDSRPITEHTMSILWQFIFTEMKSETDFDESAGAWLLNVSLSQLTEDLQRLYGSRGIEERDVSFPKNRWLRDAMEAFVRLDLASRVDNSEDQYIVFFKRLRGDIVERFARHRDSRLQERAGKQLPLFDLDEADKA